ncbi:MAG: T9SS type A sorting domain-containing protein [candidate division Zixibacteria bacterium]|nr:T9SS type A sorting domain-containing protein [candidate division Zixibacteria bacterium]
MKLRIILSMLVILAFGAVGAQAGDDPNLPDTVAFVASVVPGAGSDQLQMDIYGFSDETLMGFTMGIIWDNPKIQMDSAKATSLITDAFAIGPFFYEEGSLATTNTNQRFQLGGTAMMSYIAADAGGRRLWASYYFTATDWTESDCVTFDTLKYGSGTEFMFVDPGPPQNQFVPRFEGILEVGTCVEENLPPVVDGIPDQTITEGSTFATISLDNYVADPDNTDDEMTWTYSGNTDLTVVITDRVATITTPGAEWSGAETITFKAADPDGLFDDDAAIFEVTAVNDAPVVTDIPDQTIAEGGSFATITLDDFVSDADNTDEQMIWTFSGNTDLTVVITDRVATITTPGTEWSGAETITFKAADPDGLFDDDAAIFEVTAVNDAPVVTDIPDQTIDEGGSFETITLDDFVSDIDNTDEQMTWTFSGNTDLTVVITDRVATISTPASDWSGAETITFKAADPDGLFDENAAIFTVTPADENPPVITDIPDQTIAEGGSFATITLDDFVSDADNTDEQMIWTFSGNTDLTVVITDRVATITTPGAEWNGAETITFKAADPDGLFDENAAIFEVTAVNDAPVVTDIEDQTIAEGGSFATITLDDFVSDVDNTDEQMTWTYSGNTDLTVDITDRVATITTPDAEWSGAETITFKAADPDGLFDENAAIFEVTAVNDAPVIADIPDQTIAEGGSFATITLDDFVSDADNTDEQMTWTYSGNTDLTVVITDRVATITTPASDWNGAETITFKAADPDGLFDENAAIFTVSSVNIAPVLAEIGAQSGPENAELSFGISATDPDGTTPTLDTADVPAGASFVDNGGGTGTFTWTPTYDDADVYYVTFIAFDGELADSEVVEITVINTNRLPVVDAVSDTTIDECGELVLTFVATDPDGDDLTFVVDPLAANMTFDDATNTFTFDPDTTQAGVYNLVLTVSDGMDPVEEPFVITVEDCIILSEDTFVFETEPGSSTGSATLQVESSGDPFCFTVVEDPDVEWLEFSPEGVICVPPLAEIVISYDVTDMPSGTYVANCSIVPVDPAKGAAFEPVAFTVTVIVPTADFITIAGVGGVPGSEVVVPVTFTNNSCDLAGIYANLAWTSEYLSLVMVTWEDSRVEHFSMKEAAINPIAQTVLLAAGDESELIGTGTGNFVNLHFKLASDIPAGTYNIGFLPKSAFLLDCGDGFIDGWPEETAGHIVVGDNPNFVCGYVTDTLGIPIPGATVDLYGEFPIGPVDMTTMSSETGAFSFSDIMPIPFDLWAYHEGYYPTLVENVNYGDIGIMIELTPVEPIIEHHEFVFFYCGENLYFDELLPVGSVIGAYDSNNVLCGTWFVSELGAYGAMPVYGDLTDTEEDEGADPGEIIRFFINNEYWAQTDVEAIWQDPLESWQVCLSVGEITKTCDLLEGWNLVSWSVDHEDDYILDALSSLGDTLLIVVGFEQGGLIYDAALPQFSTLWYVDHLSGYWIKVSENVTLEMTGVTVSPATPIEVTAGWNLVSYLPDYAMPVEIAVSSLDGNLIVLFGQDGAYIPGDLGNMAELAPCNGYWVKVAFDDELIYEASGPMTAPQQRRELGTLATAAAISDVVASNRWMNAYASNLTLDGQTVLSGAIITAHAQDGHMVGSFTMEEDGLFGFMPVYGDISSTEEVEGIRNGETFYLAIDGVETAEAFAFSSGIGDRVEITNLSTGKSTDNNLPTVYGLSQNYPNPFNPTTNIAFTLPNSGTARIEVFNILGELVATPFDGMATAGENRIEWDGQNSRGKTVSSGIYFYRLTADNYSETKKMTLLK